MNGLAKQYFLECLWTLSFHEEVAEQMRQNSEFILSLENIPKPEPNSNQENILRRSTSFSNLRNSMTPVSKDVANNGIFKMADGLLWNLVKGIILKMIVLFFNLYVSIRSGISKKPQTVN